MGLDMFIATAFLQGLQNIVATYLIKNAKTSAIAICEKRVRDSAGH